MSLRRYVSSKPTRVYEFRYERPDGKYRTIKVPSPRGRFKLASLKAAQEIAERRLSEQYGDALFAAEERVRAETNNPNYIDLAAELVRRSPGLHQENYKLVSAKVVK